MPDTHKNYEIVTAKGVLPEDIYTATNLEMKDILAPAAIKVTPTDLYVGEKILRTLFVISYPRYLSQDWFTPVINLDKVYDISIMIHPVETELVLRTFQKKVAEVQSQINERERKGYVRDPILDVAYNDLEDLRDKLQQAQERLFNVGVYITIYASDKAELDHVEGELKSILDSKLVYLKPAIFQQEAGYRCVLPLMTYELEVHY
ncbi:MAG: conjugal transfer protein TraC, partial [Patescibacteria group bacterium]